MAHLSTTLFPLGNNARAQSLTVSLKVPFKDCLGMRSGDPETLSRPRPWFWISVNTGLSRHYFPDRTENKVLYGNDHEQDDPSYHAIVPLGRVMAAYNTPSYTCTYLNASRPSSAEDIEIAAEDATFEFEVDSTNGLFKCLNNK
ncbi:hypothetical protein AFLA70_61g003891 [Aspergillus flavus AF70]|nr:hypothetical protein AFLA70_61g003891 [Aspergillus flavus AF70]